MECATCAAKPGSPYLCKSCLHNRTLISELKQGYSELLAIARRVVRERRSKLNHARETSAMIKLSRMVD